MKIVALTFVAVGLLAVSESAESSALIHCDKTPLTLSCESVNDDESCDDDRERGQDLICPNIAIPSVSHNADKSVCKVPNVPISG